eukprot:6481605-Amphidinium_carterae.1
MKPDTHLGGSLVYEGCPCERINVGLILGEIPSKSETNLNVGDVGSYHAPKPRCVYAEGTMLPRLAPS